MLNIIIIDTSNFHCGRWQWRWCSSGSNSGVDHNNVDHYNSVHCVCIIMVETLQEWLVTYTCVQCSVVVLAVRLLKNVTGPAKTKHVDT